MSRGVELGRWPRRASLRIRPRLPSGMGGREADLVAHHVIRVGIAPARWFSDDHAGAQPANDPHKAAHRLARSSLGKRVPVLIRGCPRHPRIPVAQHAHLCDPKQSTRYKMRNQLTL